jgi:glycosyltransferase involved in cell wall biosynthesis
VCRWCGAPSWREPSAGDGERIRVLIDTTFRTRGPSGTSVYLDGVTAALRELGVEVIEAANAARRPPAGGGLGSVRNLTSDLRWLERDLPALARHSRADVLHHPLPACSRRAGCRQVVTVHDLAFLSHPELFARGFRTWAGMTHGSAAVRADAVVCVSQSTRDRMLSQWRVRSERVVVAQHGPGQALPERPRAARPTHFLYVGDDEPRKALGVLIEAHARYRDGAGAALPLVLAGPDRPAPASGITVVPRPGPDALADLYAGAAALVHPAVEEGFGLTLIEAMASGAPVLAARSAAAAEVCAQAAVYVEPGDVEGLTAQLARLAGDAGLGEELSRLGRARAAEFSWERSARDHLAAYTLACR